MRRLLPILLSSTLLIVALALGLFLLGHPRAEAATIGVFFDPGGSQFAASPPLFTTTNEFWVFGFDLDQPYEGYEFSLDIEPHIIVFDRTIPPGATDLDGDPANSNWLVRLANCTSEVGIQELARLRYGVFAGGLSDLAICMAPASPSSVDPPWPAYLGCDESWSRLELAVLEHWGDGCSVVYPTSYCEIREQVYGLRIGDATADPGALVPVPVRLSNPELGCYLPLGEFDGVRLTVQWDPAVASLEGVEPSSATQGWSLAPSIEPGSVDVFMQNDTPVTAGRQAADWLLLMFRAALQGGSTDLRFFRSYVLTGDYQETTYLHDGSLTVLPVAAGQTSFSALKSRY